MVSPSTTRATVTSSTPAGIWAAWTGRIPGAASAVSAQIRQRLIRTAPRFDLVALAGIAIVVSIEVIGIAADNPEITVSGEIGTILVGASGDAEIGVIGQAVRR